MRRRPPRQEARGRRENQAQDRTVRTSRLFAGANAGMGDRPDTQVSRRR
jgi:hypothetical protein